MPKGVTNTWNLLKATTDAISEMNPDVEWKVRHIKVATIILAFSALEGHLNFLGSRIAPDLWKDERSFFGPKSGWSGTLGKAKYLAQQCDFPIEKGRRPFQTLILLERIRNRLMHPKQEEFEAGSNSSLLCEIQELTLEQIKGDVFTFCEELQSKASSKFQVTPFAFGNVLSAEPVVK